LLLSEKLLDCPKKIILPDSGGAVAPSPPQLIRLCMLPVGQVCHENWKHLSVAALSSRAGVVTSFHSVEMVRPTGSSREN